MRLTTRIHGLIDWASVALLGAAPSLFGWRGRSRRLMQAAAAGTAIYSLATDYEWGAAPTLPPALPMDRHLLLDAAQGAGFLAAAAVLRREPLSARAAMAAYGLVVLGMVAMTDRRPRLQRHHAARHHAALARREAAARLHLADAGQ